MSQNISACLNMSQHVSKHAQHSTLPRVLCKGKFQTAHILRHQALLPLLSLHFDQHASFRSQASCKAGKKLLQPSLAKKSCSHNFYIHNFKQSAWELGSFRRSWRGTKELSHSNTRVPLKHRKLIKTRLGLCWTMWATSRNIRKKCISDLTRSPTSLQLQGGHVTYLAKQCIAHTPIPHTSGYPHYPRDRTARTIFELLMQYGLCWKRACRLSSSISLKQNADIKKAQGQKNSPICFAHPAHPEPPEPPAQIILDVRS